MTIGGCLEQIRTLFLDNDIEKMSRVGIKLIRHIKEDVYFEGHYPRTGWYLLIKDDGPYVVNGDAQVKVELNQLEDDLHQQRQQKRLRLVKEAYERSFSKKELALLKSNLKNNNGQSKPITPSKIIALSELFEDSLK